MQFAFTQRRLAVRHILFVSQCHLHPLEFTFAPITVAIDAMGADYRFVMPDLLLSMGQDSMADAALWVVCSRRFTLMQFLFSPVIGNLSDRYGRRPVLLVAMAAMAVDYVVLTLAPNLALLVIG